MNTLTLEAEFFASNLPSEEASTMSFRDYSPDKGNYAAIAGQTCPDNLIINVQEGLDSLKMFTQGLKVLAAPPALCLRKAIELLEINDDFEVNLNFFKLDLTCDQTTLLAFDEVDALINGIRALAEFLRDYFNQYGLFINKTLAYEFLHFEEPGMLVLTKFMVFDGNKYNANGNRVSPSSDQSGSCLAVLPVAA